MKPSDFLPPIVTKAAKRLLRRNNAAPAAAAPARKVYATYAEALADCSENGYENSDVVGVVLEKSKRYRDRIRNGEESLQVAPANACALCAFLPLFGQREINVLDFGGGCGAHYFLARALLPAECKLRWVVVETPEMARRAGAELTDAELSFSSNLDEAAAALGRIDLLHTSGCLQCTDAPRRYLQNLLALRAPRLMLARNCLAKGEQDAIEIHESWLSWNGPGPLPEGYTDRKVRYPMVFMPQTEFMQTVSAAYNVTAIFDDRSGAPDFNGLPLVGASLMCELKR